MVSVLDIGCSILVTSLLGTFEALGMHVAFDFDALVGTADSPDAIVVMVTLPLTQLFSAHWASEIVNHSGHSSPPHRIEQYQGHQDKPQRHTYWRYPITMFHLVSSLFWYSPQTWLAGSSSTLLCK